MRVQASRVARRVYGATQMFARRAQRVEMTLMKEADVPERRAERKPGGARCAEKRDIREEGESAKIRTMSPDDER